jgi:serine/threonine protein phosphatase PrpC
VVHRGRTDSIIAVADGVGGGPAGEFASCAAVDAVMKTLGSDTWSDAAHGLSEAFDMANQKVFDITGDGRAATTLVVALVSVDGGSATIGNVGDSRAYVVARGRARQITEDHSLVAARVEAGQMTAAEAREAPDRNLLIRAVGSAPQISADVFGPLTFLPGEVLVLCTDGVHGLIEDGDIARFASRLPIEGCAGALVAAAVEAVGTDNATAIVGGFVPHPQRTADDEPRRLRRLLSLHHRPHIRAFSAREDPSDRPKVAP